MRTTVVSKNDSAIFPADKKTRELKRKNDENAYKNENFKRRCLDEPREIDEKEEERSTGLTRK